MTTAGGIRFHIASELDRRLWRLQRSPTQTWRSPARFGSISAKEINASDADVVNLHWITDGFITIEQIARIEKPVVWSLYDMWAFCGTEHYGVDADDARWRTGYTKHNRPETESGWDIDRDAWGRKRRLWNPMHAVPASTWLTRAAQESALVRDWPITRVPHVVDATAFAPMDKDAARTALGLPRDVPLVLFLASAGITDERKGWDLLEHALPRVRAVHPDVQVVVVGPQQPDYTSPSGVPILWQGSVSGDETLHLLYSACDVTAAPSREDNMPLTAMEAQTCGRPVVSFDIGGLPDIVVHHGTGYLAPAFDVEALAEGVIQSIDDAGHDGNWGRAAREHATATWSAEAVVPQYLDVYARAMA